MADSFERKVFDNLKTILATNLSWAKYVEYQTVKLVSEFKDTELPAIQFYFLEEPFLLQKQRGHAQVDLRIMIEAVMKSTAVEPIVQGDFLDRLRDIREVLGDNLQLGITDGQIFHVIPVRASRDFLTQAPYMIGQLEINVQGQVPYGDC